VQTKIGPLSSPVFEHPARTLVRLDTVSSVDGSEDWALALPPLADIDTWICCIHGHGSSGDQLYTRRDLRERMLPQFLSRGYGILTPNLRGNAWMCPRAAQDLHDLFGVVRRAFGAGRFILASGSMGGSSNLIYACLYPADVAGVIARGAATDLASYHGWCRENQDSRRICGEIADAIESHYGATPETNPELYRRHSAVCNAECLTMPVFLSHGTDDRTIPVWQARQLVGRLAHSPTLCYTEIPGGNHDSPLFLQTDPHPLDWIETHLPPARLEHPPESEEQRAESRERRRAHE
jgi:pimeloyl-ACP methyl ester carboxylesterase